MNSITSMIRYYKKNYSKDEAVSKVHSGGLTPGYQKVRIYILPVEDLSATCLLLKNQTPKRQYDILKEKIQSLVKEAAEMSIRYNQTPLSQNSLITIPSSVAPSVHVTRLAPTAKEEALQSKMSKLENDMKKRQKERKEDWQRERKPGSDESGNQRSRHQGSGNQSGNHKPGNGAPRQDGNQPWNQRPENGAPRQN